MQKWRVQTQNLEFNLITCPRKDMYCILYCKRHDCDAAVLDGEFFLAGLYIFNLTFMQWFINFIHVQKQENEDKLHVVLLQTSKIPKSHSTFL
jgi:hypothetical protein